MSPRARTLSFLLLAVLVALPAPAQEKMNKPALETVTLPNPDSPLVSLQVWFDAGSIYDPPGKEGLAALTALMIGEASAGKRSYAERLDALYPLAASITTGTDREVTVFAGDVHRDTLDTYTGLVTEALLEPAFREDDFARNKETLVAYLTTTLRAGDDELLGLEALQDAIFIGHPYGHPPEGTVEGLKSITLDDVKSFYRQRYTRASLMLGVAGGYPAGYAEKLAQSLAALPAGTPGRLELPRPPAASGRRYEIIGKDAAATGIHFGHALAVNRSSPDYYPLMIANSFLGEHRTAHGRLMQQLRGERGFNYGDYSYVEFWADPPDTNTPSPGFPRRQQYFSVWLRPVPQDRAHFALRNALSEVSRLREKGLTAEEFELTRTFLLNYSKLWVQKQSDRLGFHMDSRFYGMPYYIDEIAKRLPGITAAEVQAAARKYLSTDAYVAVLVAGDAGALKTALEKDAPSPIRYDSQVPAAILEADKQIEGLKVRPTAVEVVPIEQVFQAGKPAGK